MVFPYLGVLHGKDLISTHAGGTWCVRVSVCLCMCVSCVYVSIAVPTVEYTSRLLLSRVFSRARGQGILIELLERQGHFASVEGVNVGGGDPPGHDATEHVAQVGRLSTGSRCWHCYWPF